MGQKTPPRLNRLNIVESQKSTGKWFATRVRYASSLHQDLLIRNFLEQFNSAGIVNVQIERTHDSITVTVFCARPAVIIGRKGSDVESLKAKLVLLLGTKVHLRIKEVKKVDLQAKLVSEGIAQQLVKRVMFRKAMKRALQNTMRAGAFGIRIEVSGRLGGAEIARSEKYHAGRVPLHTFKADIDYNAATALTTYGIIGVKVWIYRPDNFEQLSAGKKQRRDSDK